VNHMCPCTKNFNQMFTSVLMDSSSEMIAKNVMELLDTDVSTSTHFFILLVGPFVLNEYPILLLDKSKALLV